MGIRPVLRWFREDEDTVKKGREMRTYRSEVHWTIRWSATTLLVMAVGVVITGCGKGRSGTSALRPEVEIVWGPGAGADKVEADRWIELAGAFEMPGTNRWIVPRTVAILRGDQLAERWAMPDPRNWVHRFMGTKVGPTQYNGAVEKFFDRGIGAFVGHEEPWRQSLAAAPKEGGDSPSLEKYLGAAGDAVVVALGGRAGMVRGRSVEHCADVASLRTAVGKALAERVAGAEGGGGKARRVAPPKVIIVAFGEDPPPPDDDDDDLRAMIEIEAVPPGTGAGDGISPWPISGRVEGLRATEGCRVVLYSLNDKWVLQEGDGGALLPLSPDRTWSGRARLGREYAALLVHRGYQPGTEFGEKDLPKVDGKVILAVTTRYPAGAAGVVPEPQRPESPVMETPAKPKEEPIARVVSVPTVEVPGAAKREGDFVIDVRCDKTSYVANRELMKLSVRAERDCWVRVYCQRADGLVVQLIPNFLYPNPQFLKAGETLTFPPQDSNWEFRVKEPRGTDRIRVVGSSIAFSDPDLPVGAHDVANKIFPEFRGQDFLAVVNRGVDIQYRDRPNQAPAQQIGASRPPAQPPISPQAILNETQVAYGEFQYTVE